MTNPIQGLAAAGRRISARGSANQGPGELGFSRHAAQRCRSGEPDLQSQADTQVASMLNGNGQDVHSAMIAVEKANLTFELMVQVRNKIVSAYQEVSKIPF